MDKLIFKKLSGEALSDRENKILSEWIDSDLNNKKTYFQLKMAFLKSDPVKINELKEAMWKDLERNTGHKKAHQKFYFLKWAASILLIISLGASIYLFNEHQNTEISEDIKINYIEKVTPKGQKLTVTLSDGSRVKLNARSRLISPDRFMEERWVQVEGEAFFEITKSSKPFIVKVGDLEVRVLGTSFNINAYASDQVSIAVATGKVSVSTKANDFIIKRDLIPGEQAVYKVGEPILEVSEYKKDEVFGWKDNLLVFKDNTFPEVTKDLNNWYNVTFILDDKISFEETFNGTFVNPSLTEVMESLAHLYSFNYKIDGKQVSISNKK